MDLKSKYRNERDVEIPLLLEFIKTHQEIKTVLDVGCAHSLYAPQVRKLVDVFDGADFELDKKIVKYVDNFFQGDFAGGNFSKYDLVFSISAIEHYGMKYSQAEFPFSLQQNLIKRMALHTKKYLFLSFPYGQPAKIANDFVVHSSNSVEFLFRPIPLFDFSFRYFTNASPASGDPWVEVGKMDADSIKYAHEKGVTCVCLVRGEKANV